jgi:ACS family sodium-dependent inorganic phosphate cotransporter/ACS family sodium-dependent inorganic phosphate cotransporter-like MFS transporter 9
LVLSPLILLQFGWRALFLTFGMLGIPLLAVWLATAPKPLPKAHPKPLPPSLTAAAGSSGLPAAADSSKAGAGADADNKPVSLLQLLSHPATWAIIIVNIVNHWGYFIYLNWMPTYFVKVGFPNVTRSGRPSTRMKLGQPVCS